ncbi:MAG TPA: DUF4437 domain-containing protein [Bdellovibrionota bacterium]|nr:DUF4437 domain-containing protein [Bdellovibrionota bacterium]
MHSRSVTVLWASACALALLVGPMAFAAKGKSSGVITSYDKVQFFPMDPKNPDGGKIGVASGDPQKGAAQFYLKLKPGSAGMHSHSADYQAVVVKGDAKHWVTGTEADAETLKPGSYWFQARKQVHGDTCIGPDECLIFIDMKGKFDFIPAPQPKH